MRVVTVKSLVVYSIVISVLSVIISIWGVRWMRVIISIVLLLTAADVTTLRFDNVVRAVAAADVAQGSSSVAYLEGVQALRNELFPYMGILLIVCCGLFALGVSRKR